MEESNHWHPAGAVTGIGSLPQTDAEEAVRYVARACPAVPFWPQLPQRSKTERMIDQALAPLRDLVKPCAQAPWTYCLRPDTTLDTLLGALHERDVSLPHDAAAGFSAFERAWQAGQFPKAQAVKGQLLGPITLGMHLYRGQSGGRAFIDHPLLMEALSAYLGRLACWQVNCLSHLHQTVLLFIDEPMLDREVAGHADSSLTALNHMVDQVQQAGALAGVHSCQPGANRWLNEITPSFWAFDAHQDLAGFCGQASAQSFVKNGGGVAYGLVPTGDALAGLSAESMFTRWLQAASLMGDVTDLAQRSLITASCGLGRVDPTALNATFNLAHRVSQLVGWIASGHHQAHHECTNQ